MDRAFASLITSNVSDSKDEFGQRSVDAEVVGYQRLDPLRLPRSSAARDARYSAGTVVRAGRSESSRRADEARSTNGRIPYRSFHVQDDYGVRKVRILLLLSLIFFMRGDKVGNRMRAKTVGLPNFRESLNPTLLVAFSISDGFFVSDTVVLRRY